MMHLCGKTSYFARGSNVPVIEGARPPPAPGHGQPCVGHKSALLQPGADKPRTIDADRVGRPVPAGQRESVLDPLEIVANGPGDLILSGVEVDREVDGRAKR